MNKLNLSFALVALLSQSAFAGSDRGPLDHERSPSSDTQELASATEPAAGVSTADKPSGIMAQSLRDEVLGISPQVGAVGYSDLNGNYTSRMAYGVNLNFNVVPLAFENAKDVYLGVSSGVYYAHMGANTSNFVGADANPGDFSSTGANLLVIPVDLKAGYNLQDNLRLAAHGGGNLTYRSVGNSADFGPNTSGTDGEVWRIYPNAGAEVEWTVAKDLTLTARPDFTFTPGQVLYMTTVGISAPLALLGSSGESLQWVSSREGARDDTRTGLRNRGHYV